VLQGSVRRAGNRVRVTAQLMNARDGFQLWSERFDRDLDDIFAIQDEIARSIVERLELTLGLRPEKSFIVKPTDDLAAYELYLRGREAVLQRTTPSMRRGLDFFEQALERDPHYARAHLGVAEAWIGLGVYQALPVLEAGRNADAAIAVAESLDPTLVGIHLLRGQLKLYLRADWDTSGIHFEEVLRRTPDDPFANSYMAALCGLLGDRTARSKWAARAVKCDPLSPHIRALAGMSYYFSGDYEDALVLYEEGLAMDSNSVVCLWQAAMSLERLGRHDEELVRIRRAVELSRRGILMLSFEYRALSLLGRKEEAQALVDEVIQRAEHEHVGEMFWFAPALFGGDDEAADAALRLNLETGSGPTTLAFLDKELEALLPHPTLGPLVRQLTLFAPRFRNVSATLAHRH
jgi:serine/threonine-protein kinase